MSLTRRTLTARRRSARLDYNVESIMGAVAVVLVSTPIVTVIDGLTGHGILRALGLPA
jgi:hypothetical protein